MAISVQDVEKIAQLARLRFDEDEKVALVAQLGRIVALVERLDELDTDDVEPTYHVLDIHNAFREDVLEPSLSRDEVLGNAPAAKNGFFSVPKVIS